jgi:predicted Zn-dependent protease
MKARTAGIAISALFVFVCISWILSCAVNPVTGDRELMLLSKQDEIALGKQTDAQIIQTYGIYENEDLNRYLEDLGSRMAAVTHRPDLPYTFRVLDAPVVNAFAVPGGFVYFTRGILAYFNSEAELAGVMGHELGHIAARHSAVQYSRATLANLGLGLGSMLSEKFREYAGLAQFGVGLLFLRFSRDNERQSDDLGVEYSVKMGYDATAMAHFFQTLERLHPSSGQNGLPEWFSTHPNPENRVKAVNEKAAAWKAKTPEKQYAVKEEAYLRQLDGMVFGEDPRQGYVEGNAFYHPVMTFVVPVPSNWKVNNTPSQVQMLSSSEDALLMLTVQQNANSAQSASEFVSQTKATVLSRESVQVNGMAAERLISEIADQQQLLQVMSYFIQKGNSVFTIHGLSGKEVFSQYQSVFSNTMQGFRRLTDPQKINVKPARLQVRESRRSGTAKEVLSSLGVSAGHLEDAILLNGLSMNDRIEKGDLVKTVKY